MHRYEVVYTDAFCGVANYSWVTRAVIAVPELTHYGYTGSTDGSYAKASAAARRELIRRAKSAVGLTGSRGVTTYRGDNLEFRPYRSPTIMFVTFRGEA